MSRLSALFGSALLAVTDAWGADGHTIIAHIADDLLDPAVSKVLMADLGKESLSDAAVWCDDFDHTASGRWSAPLHYINYPGTSCSFDWQRDCKNDICNVGALSNYTQQIWDTSLSADDRLMALNFMIHMTGDLHQPLHVASGDDRGGNMIHVKYQFSESAEEKKTNLHKVWDSDIIIQMINDLSLASSVGSNKRGSGFHNYQVLVDDLLKRIKGDWASNATAWQSVVLEHRDDSAFQSGLTKVAQESAVASCEYAYVQPDGSRIQSGDELQVDYYKRANPVVSLQLAKAGVRLAEILKDSLSTSIARRIITV